MCRMYFLSENEVSEKARRMLSCRNCDKKYHRSCLKLWAQHRDLFHWKSWTYLYFRTYEVCRSTGDPTRLMFCKRCDGAYHCYCQHPSYKNVTSEPYLCPKYTRCHSYGSNAFGNSFVVLGIHLLWCLWKFVYEGKLLPYMFEGLQTLWIDTNGLLWCLLALGALPLWWHQWRKILAVSSRWKAPI